METAERWAAILKLLCRRRHETIANLAREFGVSERTMRRDVEVLSRTEPIYTQAGRYGGVFAMEEFKPDYLYLSQEETGLLYRLLLLAETQAPCCLSSQDLSLLKKMAVTHAKPQSHRKEPIYDEPRTRSVYPTL